MAELRDRYLKHGFDENGNDPNSKLMEKLVRVLSENNRLAKLQLDFDKEQVRKNISQGAGKVARGAVEGVGGAVIGAAKTVGGVIGEGAKNLAAPQTVKDMMAVAGPAGYVLSKLIPTISTVTGWGKDKKKSRGELTTEEANKSQTGQDKKDKDVATKTFESYPTIIRLKAWLDYQAKTVKDEQGNRELLKMQLKYYTNTKAREKESKETAKKQDTWLSKLALVGDMVVKNQKLIAGLVFLGIAGIAGLVALVKSKLPKPPSISESPQNLLTDEEIQGFGSQGISMNLGKTTYVSKGSTGKGSHESETGWGARGMDIASINPSAYSLKGRPALALIHGTVTTARTDTSASGGFGKFVIVTTDVTEKDKVYNPRESAFIVGRLEVLYGHLLEIKVKPGAKVATGGTVGLIGNTGHVEGGDGTHLHITIRRVLPNGQYEYFYADELMWDYNGTTMSTYELWVAQASNYGKEHPIKETVGGAISSQSTYEDRKRNLIEQRKLQGHPYQAGLINLATKTIPAADAALRGLYYGKDVANERYLKSVRNQYGDVSGDSSFTTRDKATVGMQANNTTIDNSRLAPLEVINDPELYTGSVSGQSLPAAPQSILSFNTTTPSLNAESKGQLQYEVGARV